MIGQLRGLTAQTRLLSPSEQRVDKAFRHEKPAGPRPAFAARQNQSRRIFEINHRIRQPARISDRLIHRPRCRKYLRTQPVPRLDRFILYIQKKLEPVRILRARFQHGRRPAIDEKMAIRTMRTK